MTKASPRSTPEWGIHWFRRDLRVPDNAALAANHERTGGHTLGLFCFDSKFLSRDDFSPNRFAFFLKTIRALREDWRRQGGDLLVVDCLPREAFTRIFAWARTRDLGPPAVVTFNRDYEPFARRRDAEMTELFQAEGVDVRTFRDHLLFEPDEIKRGPGPTEFYQIYSAYARKWFAAAEGPEGQARLAGFRAVDAKIRDEAAAARPYRRKWSDLTALGEFPFADALGDFDRKNQPGVTAPIPEAGFDEGLRYLHDFAERLPSYADQRDFPAHLATSQLSFFLKNGSLTLGHAFNFLKLARERDRARPGAQKFAQEMVWREFFYSILYHRPDVEGGEYNKKYADRAWENDPVKFDRWREGTTGFPIVDAAMRQLKQTGWITNRVRIIVASFLIKDLLIDWRWGELHFMKLLIDGDLANNNGNWQWTASTGAEAQPYFRVLNPWLQGQRFDPDGEYIKRYVPELESVPGKSLHDPKFDRTRFGYPAPMVDHAAQKDRAIQLYKS